MQRFDALASKQHGLVKADQAGSKDAVSRAVRSGRLIRVHPGVFRVAGAPVTWKQRVLAACFATDGVASHRAAGHLWGLIRSTTQIEVTVPYKTQKKAGFATVYRSRNRFGVRRVDGIPVTDPSRTLIDIASVLRKNELGVILDNALRRRLVKLDQLETMLLPRRKGIGDLRALVADRVGNVLSEGELETRFFDLIEKLDIPRPKRQHKIFERGVEIARLDIAYPDEKIAIEIDAYSDHSDMLAFVRDRRRNNMIAADHGFQFLHFTRADLAQPRYVRNIVLKTLEQRGRT